MWAGAREMWVVPLVVLPANALSVLHQPLYLAIVSSLECD